MRQVSARGWADRRGGLALVTALALPVFLLAVGAAVQLQSLQTDKSALQNVSDSAALWGARQLALNPVGVESRTQQFAMAQLQRFGGATYVQASVQTTPQNTLSVALDAQRPSLFGSLLQAGGFHTHVQSTAQAMNSLPLCVQVFGPQSSDQLTLADGATATANGCLVHSRGAIDVGTAADLDAGAVETESATADGRIMPTAMTDAPPLADPFSALSIAFPEPCSATPGPTLSVGANRPLSLSPKAGSALVVQNPIQFDGTGGVLSLAPGEYYFCRTITAYGGPQAIAQQQAQGGAGAFTGAPAPDAGVVTGSNVTLIFADGAKLSLGPGASVDLSGRQSGPLAGFVLIAGLSQPNNVFPLRFDEVRSLLGAVYVRQGLLDGQGVYKTSSTSAWTAVVANQFTLHRPPQTPFAPFMAIESSPTPPFFAFAANFAGSSVPRPAGVGDNVQLALARVRLVN